MQNEMGGTAQNCFQGSTISALGYQQQFPHIIYQDRYMKADILIDKVENGFILVISGKKYIVGKISEISEIIEAAFE